MEKKASAEDYRQFKDYNRTKKNANIKNEKMNLEKNTKK